MTINNVCYVCFKNCRESWEDGHRFGRPSTSLMKKSKLSTSSCVQIEDCYNMK
jgi:hypothetical protein